MLRRDCRHRLGLTVAVASRAERKPYGSRLQTTLPCAEVIRALSSVPRNPREASSKSLTSENGSAFSVAACRATTDGRGVLGGFAIVGFGHVAILPRAARRKSSAFGLRPHMMSTEPVRRNARGSGAPPGLSVQCVFLAASLCLRALLYWYAPMHNKPS